jgi:hypothetical protein
MEYLMKTTDLSQSPGADPGFVVRGGAGVGEGPLNVLQLVVGRALVGAQGGKAPPPSKVQTN